MTDLSPLVLAARSPSDPEPDLTSLLVTHRAIRQDLARLAEVLACGPDVSAADDRRALRRYTAGLLAEISNHLDHEDAIFWPVIAATAGQCVDLGPLTDDHQAIGAALGRFRAAIAASPPGHTARLGELVGELADMLGQHIADEEAQIIPAMRRYMPACACRWCEKQTWQRASLASSRFRAAWLARFARPGELTTALGAAGWKVRLLQAAARRRYARLERRAFVRARRANSQQADSHVTGHPPDVTRHATALSRPSHGDTHRWNDKRPGSPAATPSVPPGTIRERMAAASSWRPGSQ